MNIIRADKIIFLVGEKESWLIKDVYRLTKDLEIPYDIKIVKKAGHKIDRNYLKEILKVLA